MARQTWGCPSLVFNTARDTLVPNAFKAGGKAMEKHDVEQKLKSLLAAKKTQGDEEDWWREVIEYMKTLSPSGVELEIMNLVSFDFSKVMQDNPNFYVSCFCLF